MSGRIGRAGGALGAAGLVVAGCALAATVLPAGAEAQAAVVGSDSARRDADALIDALHLAERPGLAMTVVRDGRVLYQRAVGLADLAHGVPIRESTVFAWESVAKQVTAFAVAVLAQDGVLALDDPASRYVDGLERLGPPITIRQLVHHTSGVEDTEGLLALAGIGPDDRPAHAQVVALLERQRQLRAMPGSRHQYSNGGYVLLAEIVSRATKTPFARWVEERLFGPLGMTSASFPDRPGQIVEAVARPYATRDGSFTEAALQAAPGPGGLYATTADMARWGANLIAGVVEPRVASGPMRGRGRLGDGTVLDYGFGVVHGEHRGLPTLSHAGSGPGSQSFLSVYPEQGLVVAAASNTSDDPNVARLATRVVELLLADELGPEPTTTRGPTLVQGNEAPPPESLGVNVDAAELASFEGVYRMDDGWYLAVRAEGDRLYVAFDGRRPFLRVHPLPSGRFVLMPVRYEFGFDRTDDGGTRVFMHAERSVHADGGPRTVLGRRVERTTRASEEAEELRGVYFNQDLLSAYEVTTADGELVLGHARLGAMPLRRLDADLFAIDEGPLVLARFVRDGVGERGGRVVGMQLEARAWGATATFRRLGGGP